MSPLSPGRWLEVGQVTGVGTGCVAKFSGQKEQRVQRPVRLGQISCAEGWDPI